MVIFFFSSRRRHTRCSRDWSSDVCSSDLNEKMPLDVETAYKFLVAQPTVSAGILVVGGASCGVNQSVHLAMKHPEIKALVLLSEITDIDGRNFLRAQIGRASCRERV